MNRQKIDVVFRKRPTQRSYRKYSITIPAVDSISLDGKLDEKQWQKALFIDNFIKHQQTAEEETEEILQSGKKWRKASYGTCSLLLHNEDYLYIGVEAEIKEGKLKDLKYGIWPGKNRFDNTEFIGLFIDRGKPYIYEERRHMTCWRAEYYIFVDWNGNVIDAKIPAQWMPPNEKWSSDIKVKIHRDKKRWILEGRIPLDSLAGEDNRSKLNWLINVARVSGYPKGGIPLEASSWTGTFLAKRAFYRCRLGNVPNIEVAKISLGRFPAGGKERIPTGEQQASALLYSPKSVKVNIEHEIEISGNSFIALDKTVSLKKGMNPFRWGYTAPVSDYSNTIILSKERETISVKSIDCQTAPALLLYQKNYQVAPPESISACVEIGAEGKVLSEKQLEVTFSSKESIIASRIIKEIKKPVIDLTIPQTKPYPKPGRYKLNAILSEKGKKIAVKSFFLEMLEPQKIENSGKIELIDTSETDSQVKYPVTTGIPFPKGLLQDVSQLKLMDNSQREVPCEIFPIGRWSRKGSIRWVRLNFSYDPSRKYFLYYNQGKGSLSVKEKIKLIEDENCISVKTGPLSFSVGKNGFDGFQNLKVKGVSLKGGEAEIYAIDEAGIKYSSLYSEGKTEIEIASRLKTVLKMTGSLREKGGKSVFRYLIRVTAYAGEALVKIEPTIIVTCDTRLYRFNRIGMDIPAKLPNSRFEAEIDEELKDFGILSQVSAIQKFWDSYEVSSDDKVLKRGKKLNGIFKFSNRKANLTVGIRRFRQLCPLGIKKIKDGSLEVLFWPEGIEKRWDEKKMDIDKIIHLPFAHQGPLLDFNIPREYQKVANQAPKAKGYMWSGIWNGNAMGIAPTYSFILSFGKSDTETSLRKAKGFMGYPHVSASAAWMCKSEAIGFMPILPQKKESSNPYIRDEEELLEKNFDWQMEKLKDVSFGKWNWGRLNQAFNRKLDRWRLWRIFMNTHNEAGQAPWMMFIRSGDPKYLLFARAHTNHSVDIGWCHYTEEGMRMKGYYGKKKGAVCDYKGYVPWSSGARTGYNWYVDFILFHYYLTGNLRARDTAEEIYRLLLSFYHGSGGGRSGATRLETAIRLYYFKHDGRILPFIKNHFEVKLQEQSEIGFVPGGTEFSDWLSGYYQLTGDKRAVDFSQRIAEADISRPWWYSRGAKGWQPSWEISAFVYNQTKNPQYLRPVLYRMQSGVSPWGAQWSFLQSYVGYLLYALDEVGPEIKPLAPKNRFKSFSLSKDRWTTLNLYIAEEAQKSLTIKLRGDIPEDVEGKIRVVDKEATVLASRPIPHLEWKKLALSNPPISPESAEITVKESGYSGPFKLEAKGEGAIELLLPISRPLPAEGKFGSKGVLVQNLAQVHYSAEGKLKKETGTIEIWFKPLWKSPQKREKEVPYHYHYLFDSRNENYDYGFQIYFWDSGKIGAKKLLCAGWANYNKGDSMSIPVIWQDKRWHHIAFAWKKGEKTAVGKLYLDGKLVDFMEGVNFPSFLHKEITLGTNTSKNKNSSLDGVLCLLRISAKMKEDFDLSKPPEFSEDTLFLSDFSSIE